MTANANKAVTASLILTSQLQTLKSEDIVLMGLNDIEYLENTFLQ
jgi:hypothetical protein